MIDHTTRAKDGVEFKSGAEHTVEVEAATPASIGVFSRPEFTVLGLGMPRRKAGSMATSMCSNPVPSYGLNSRKAGFQSQVGIETMKPTTTGTHAQITPTSGKTTTSLNQHQKAHECIARAKVLLTSGNAQLCLGQLQVASRALKQVCGGARHE